MNESLKKEEVLTYIEKTEKDQQSKAQYRKQLFNKYKKIIRTYYKLQRFNEPVMFLERRSGQVEFYEKVTAGLFEFEHSDGERRFIIINPSKQKKFGFASRQFKGYICHEDYPLPLPQDPLVTSEQVNILIEKSLNDIKKWKAQELKAKTGMIKWIALGIAIIIGALALYAMLSPTTPPTTIIQTTQPIAQAINMSTGTII